MTHDNICVDQCFKSVHLIKIELQLKCCFKKKKFAQPGEHSNSNTCLLSVPVLQYLTRLCGLTQLDWVPGS